MATYRQKPMLVTAEQWFPKGEWPGSGKTDALGVVWNFDADGNPVSGSVETPDGWRRVARGDWIITEASGARRKCSTEDFHERYEVVGD